MILFGAVLTTSSKRRAEGDLRNAWARGDGTDGYDSGDYVKTSFEGYRCESEAAVVADTHVAIMEGFEFFISGTNAIIYKQAVPKAAILKVRWAAMNTVMWRRGETPKIKGASLETCRGAIIISKKADEDNLERSHQPHHRRAGRESCAECHQKRAGPEFCR